VKAIESQLFGSQMLPQDVAAVFVEAVQSETGYTVPDPSFLPDLRALCDKHGILLVCDEIQSGVGRTGKWFGFEHYEIVPDVILMAKGIASGMPLGAVVAKAEVMDWGRDAQGTTFGGNPVCCAAALATLDLVESTYRENAARLGPQLGSELRRIEQSRKTVANVRGMGLMHGIDVISRVGKGDPKRRHRILVGAFERGLILLPSGEHSIRFCPPLCINDVQLDVGLKIFDEVVAATA
jgi:4-aminobutyrate aminotransferase